MLCGTRQLEFGLPSELESPSTRPQGHAVPHRGSSIDQGLCADATGAPAILLEDSRPQAILKLRPPNSLDYSTRYGCQPEAFYSQHFIFKVLIFHSFQ